MRTLSLLTACLCVAGSLALGAPVIRDYQFKKVNGKPGVVPGYGAVQSFRMALTNPNPTNTGAGAGHQYLAVDCNDETYQWMGRTELYHRNDVTPYDDFQGKNSRVEYLAHSSNSGHDGRQGCVDGPVLDVFAPMGRMTHENYWVNASGGANGPYYEWQPRDARSGSVTSNEFLVYPDSDPGNDGLGVHHTQTANSDWGCGGYNKSGSLYAATVNPGATNERIRGLAFGYYYTGPYQWGSGLFEVGPWQDPGNPTSLGNRSILSTRAFMSCTDVSNLVAGVNDVFRSWYHDGRYLYFLTAGAGDNKVYLSAVEITNWSNGTWQQVDAAMGQDNMYQSFSFDSGNPDTSLTDASGFVFAPNLDIPNGPPLLYIANGKKRIFVLEAVPAKGTVVVFR